MASVPVPSGDSSEVARVAETSYRERLIESFTPLPLRHAVAHAEPVNMEHGTDSVALLWLDIAGSTRIADIFVDQDYRRQGIGAELVETMLEWFADEGIRNVEWQVAAADAGALEFWSALDGLAIMVRMRMMLADDEDEE